MAGKKAAAKKAVPAKSSAKKAAAKRPAKKAAARKYSPAASAQVGRELHEMHEGKLHSGGPNGPLVTNPKQAIAIALAEARRAGRKVPANPNTGT